MLPSRKVRESDCGAVITEFLTAGMVDQTSTATLFSVDIQYKELTVAKSEEQLSSLVGWSMAFGIREDNVESVNSR